ncbi:alpha/beta fold hydrolase [Candidatus Microgenomates bacterium]|nr:alpha/beta fold hydrolase [Candidatus Microgenomates bacterium]
MQIIKTKSFELAVNTKGDPNSKRTAICIPGRLDTKDYASFVSHLEYLVNKGFFAVSFDPPGTWKSPGRIDLYTTTNYIKAVNELIEYYGNKPTLLLGHSRGGAVALLAGCPNPSVIAMILIMAAYGDPTPPDPAEVKQGFKVSHRDLPPGDTRTKEQKRFELPVNYFKDGEQYDIMAALKNCTKPKLLFSATEDEFYTLEEMQEIYDLAAEPKMMHELKTEHDYRLNSDAIKEVNRVTGEFLDKYYSK